jgi:C4-dicarboxylate-specific signal transduction histidine kinase
VSRQAPGIVDIDTGGERPLLLVVEDEPAISDYLASLFADRFEVIQAADGRHGLALALERKPALMLLDFMLPELDGLEVCRTLKAHPRRGSTKVLMLTARTDEEVKLQALDYGADDFLTKPFSPAEVRTRVRNLLKTQTLEQRVRVRNDELSQALEHLQATQQQLLQSEKLNALGQLSAGLLHEVNNPLNYTVTALSLAKGLPVVRGDEMLADIIADIDEGMRRISTIVSDLRAFAYPSDAAKHHPFAVRAAVDKALRFTSHETRDVAVDLAAADDLEAEGSESHIVQVLVNLVTNAVKAIAARGTGEPGRIGIEVMRRAGRLQFIVSDNGVGMDEATLNQCLNPFFTTREVGSGMGMGLSICNTIISEHGGVLKVESRAGQGTTVSFDLRDFGAGVSTGVEAPVESSVEVGTGIGKQADVDTAGIPS